MKEKYLVPIKDAFLVYQPEQDVVYKGPRKTIGIWRSMRLAGISSAIFPFLVLLQITSGHPQIFSVIK